MGGATKLSNQNCHIIDHHHIFWHILTYSDEHMMNIALQSFPINILILWYPDSIIGCIGRMIYECDWISANKKTTHSTQYVLTIHDLFSRFSSNSSLIYIHFDLKISEALEFDHHYHHSWIHGLDRAEWHCMAFKSDQPSWPKLGAVEPEPEHIDLAEPCLARPDKPLRPLGHPIGKSIGNQ